MDQPQMRLETIGKAANLLAAIINLSQVLQWLPLRQLLSLSSWWWILRKRLRSKTYWWTSIKTRTLVLANIIITMIRGCIPHVFQTSIPLLPPLLVLKGINSSLSTSLWMAMLLTWCLLRQKLCLLPPTIKAACMARLLAAGLNSSHSQPCHSTRHSKHWVRVNQVNRAFWPSKNSTIASS